MKRKLLIVACLLFLAGHTAISQSSGKYGLPPSKDYDRWSVGLYFGQTFLASDVKEDPDNENKLTDGISFAPAFGLQVSRQLSHSVALRLSGGYSTFLAGPNPERVSAKLKLINGELEGSNIEGVLDGVYTFGNISHLKRNKKFHFFASLGIGVFNYDTELSGKSESTLLDTVISGSDSRIMIPLGLGFKYQIGKLDLALSYDYRKTFTDDVDQIRKPETEYDSYSMVRLGLNYTLGKKNKAMEWINPMEVVYNDIADLKDRVDLLSGDKDKDGVSDMFDKDNSTEEGTKVYGDGTAIDTDGDGIPDHKDSDPYSLRGAKVDANGAEIDTDGDGVPDSRDLEPNTPKGDLVNFQGTTIMSKDGKDGAAGAAFFPSVFFDTNSTQIKQSQKDRILIVVRALKQNPNMKITITGNTDRVGSESTNDKLGQRRADAIRDHMVKVYGVDSARLTTGSKGKREPMADNSNKAMDRRVDFTVTK